MDIYTAIADDNIKILICDYIQKYFDGVYGIHAIYKIDNKQFLNFHDFFYYICTLENEYYFHDFIENMGYYNLKQCINHFIDICPFDIIYPRNL